MCKKIILLTSALLEIPFIATAANPPPISLLQPKVFEPVIRLFVSAAIMFAIMMFIVAFIVKRFNPKYKDSSIFSMIISLWLNKKPRKENEGTVEIYSDEYPYERSNLLTRSEKDFFKALEIAILNKYHIFPQVGLSRIIDVDKSVEFNKQGHLNRILPKSVDYVVCDRENYSTLLVIELDGESHNTKDQQERDDFKDKALNKAGINLLRVIAQKTYNTGQLRETLHRYINLKG